MIFVPHIPANVHLRISDHCRKSMAIEIWIVFLTFFVLFLRINLASNDIDQLAAFTNKLLTDVGFTPWSSLQRLVPVDNRIMKLTFGWEEEPFTLPFENCVSPAVHVSGRQILDLIPYRRWKERLFGCPYGTDSSVYRGDEPATFVMAAQKPLPISRIEQQVAFSWQSLEDFKFGYVRRHCDIKIWTSFIDINIDDKRSCSGRNFKIKVLWSAAESDINKKFLDELIGADRAEQLDRFEKVQLADVLKVCKDSKNMSEAGRKVFAVSRKNKRKTNDSDRLRKYLAKYNIKWSDI